MGWAEDLNAKFSGAEVSKKTDPSWANQMNAKYDLVNSPANFTPQTALIPSKTAATPTPAGTHPNSVVFKDYKAPPKETISSTPLTGLTQSLKGDKPTEVTINGEKKTVPALYPTTFGQATDDPGKALANILGVNVDTENAPTWKKPFLAAGQSILGGIGNTVQALKDVYETAKQPPAPGLQGAFDDTAKIFGKMLKAGTSVFFEQPAFQGSMAVAQGVAQLPAPETKVAGVPVSANIVKDALEGMSAVQKGSYDAIMSGAGALNVPDNIKENIVAPVAEALSTAMMMLIMKGGEEIPGFAIEKSPLSEGFKSKAVPFVKGVTTFAVDPLRSAQDFMHAAATETKQFQDAGVPVDESIAKKIVSDTAKKVPLPNDTGAVKIQTPSGEVVVHSDNATVLHNIIKDHENLSFKKVENLTDANGNPIQAKFTWDFENQKGTMEVSDVSTAVNLSHEIGHYIDADLKTSLSKILAGNMQNYLQNKAVTDRIVMDMAVGNLEGNATGDQIKVEAIKVANELAAEAKQKAAAVKRQTENKAFLTSLGDTGKAADETTPMLSKMIAFAKGKDVFAPEKTTEAVKGEAAKVKMEGKPDVFGQPNSQEEKASQLSALEKSRRGMIKDTIANDAGFQEQQAAIEQQKLSVEERAARASENYDSSRIMRAVKQNAEWKKEGSVAEADGAIMTKNGREVFVPNAKVEAYTKKGYTKVTTMDEVANANGFKSAQDYLDFITELDKDTRAIDRSPKDKRAHKYLMANDPNYVNLDKTENNLRTTIIEGEARISESQPGNAGEAGSVPQEKGAAKVDQSSDPTTARDLLGLGADGNGSVGHVGSDTGDTGSVREKIPSQPETKGVTELKSRVFERLQAENPQLEGDLTYAKVNQNEDSNKAVDLVEKDKQEAYDRAMGFVESPDITSTALNIALAEKSLSEGNNDLYSKLVVNRSLAQTRRGQEINAEKGSVTDNSTSRYIKELVSARLDKLGDQYLGDLKLGGKKKTAATRATEAIDKEVAKIEAKIKSKKLDVKTALDLLNKNICL